MRGVGFINMWWGFTLSAAGIGLRNKLYFPHGESWLFFSLLKYCCTACSTVSRCAFISQHACKYLDVHSGYIYESKPQTHFLLLQHIVPWHWLQSTVAFPWDKAVQIIHVSDLTCDRKTSRIMMFVWSTWGRTASAPAIYSAPWLIREVQSASGWHMFPMTLSAYWFACCATPRCPPPALSQRWKTSWVAQSCLFICMPTKLM